MSSLYHSLTTPLTQDWSNADLITVDDNWSGVPSIEGYRGDDLTTATGVDPRTITGTSTVLDVNANQSNPNTFITGGVAEFTLGNPTVALNGSGTADAPYLVFYLDATGRRDIRVQFNARDLDGSSDNSVQPIALQYRIGSSGAWSNVDGGFIADASAGPSLATLVTPIDVLLPTAANGQSQVQVRVITTNAAGNDEWIGIDDINISSTADQTSVPVVTLSATDASSSEPGADTGRFIFSRTGATTAALTVSYTLGGNASSADYTPVLGGSVVIPAGQASVEITITPVDDNAVEGAESLTLTLVDAADYNLGSPAQATVTIADNDTAPIAISQVQGNGTTSPLTGQTVTVDAIVVGDFQGTPGLGGFFLQEEDADTDADPDTAEGLFVFQGADTTAVAPGDRVRVTGVVTEFGSGGATLTELSNVTGIVVLSSGHPLPTAAIVTMPRNAAGDLERFEGMRITVPGRLTVTDTFDLQRFGELTLAADGPGNVPGTDARLDIFTQFNAPGLAGNQAWLAQQALRTIGLDDGRSDQNPPVHLGRDGLPLSASNPVRAGDTVDNLAGVLDQRFGSFRVQPTGVVDIDAGNPRTAAPDVGGQLQVAALNVLNFFNGDGAGGGFPTSRGASSPAEFVRQRDKIVAAILGTGAEVVGLLELEDDGYGPASAIRDLVAALNAATAPGTWAFVDPGRPEMSTDEIAVGLIYQPAAVQPRGPAAVLDSAVDPRFDSVAQRPSLAQTFEVVATGALFTPVINHLKSKGSSAGGAGDADSGDGQGLSNGTRTRAAEALVDWLATDPTGQGDADFLILGDLNAYAQEDPLRAIRRGADDLAGSADDYTALNDAASYSFSFDGAWGALDHALASAGLAGQVTGAAKWHINADEPTALDYNLEFRTAAQQTGYYAPDAFRASDHDPVIVGLNPGVTYVGGPRGDSFPGTPGPDRIQPGGGRDLVLGGGGGDTFVFVGLLDFVDTLGDFEPGRDRIDIAALMASVGAAGADPVAGGYLRTLTLPTLHVTPTATLTIDHTWVLFDPDGSAGPAAARPMADLVGVSVTDPSLLLLLTPI